MQASPKYPILFFLIVTTSLSSLFGMEQRDLYPWPTLTYIHTEPTTFNVEPTSITISCGAIWHKYPLSGDAEELSSVQKIHNQLLEKDRAEHKEESTFTLLKSRYTQFVEQRDQIIDTCIECLNNSTTAKLELVNLGFLIDGEEKLTQELNATFHNYLQSILQEFYTYEGELKFCTPTDYENAARRIGNMFVEFFPWNECLPRIQECKKKNIPGFEKFYYDVTSPWASFKGAYQAILDTFKYLFKDKRTLFEFKNLITSNSFNNDLCKLKKAYEVSNYVIVNRTIRKYYDQNKEKREKEVAEQASHRSHLLRSYGQELSQSTFPIRRLKAIQEKHKESPIIQHISLMVQRHVTRNARLGSQVGTVVYLITALHRIPQKRLEKNNNPLDKEFADAYSTLFDNRGLPVIFQYNEEVLKSLVVSPSIGNYGKIKERLLLYKLASLRIKPEFIDQEGFKASLQNALQYLCHGLKNADHAQVYHLLIEALYDTLTNPLDSSLRSIIMTCDFLPSKEYEQAVYSIVLDHVRTLMHTLEESLSAQQEIFLHDALTALSRVWVQARNGSEKAQEILSQPSPMSALIQESFLKTPPNYEKAHNTSKHLQQRMDELGFNKIITANAYAMSAQALQKLEECCVIQGKHNEVPNFTAIIAIMHDADTPRPIIALLHNALELWQMKKQTSHIKEIAVAATQCAEVAYGYHQEEDYNYYELFLNIGNGICRYGCMISEVIVEKFTDMGQFFISTTKNAAIWNIKFAAHTSELLLDEVQRFINAISGKGYYLPKDHFKSKMVTDRYEELIRAEHEELTQQYIEALSNAAPTSVAFLARIGGADDPYRHATLKEAITVETCKAIKEYIHNFAELSNEQKFKVTVRLALDLYVDNKVFSIASKLCKWLHFALKDWAAAQKLAMAAHEAEQWERICHSIGQAQEALAGAAHKLNPNVMKSETIPIVPGGVKQAVDRVSRTVIDYLKGKEGNVIKKFTSQIYIDFEEHVFSLGHRRSGIMKLGLTRDIIIEKFANIIMCSDKDNFIKDGVNTILTQINGYKVLLRVTISEGKIISTNGFIYDGGNPRLLGNVITYIMDIYK